MKDSVANRPGGVAVRAVKSCAVAMVTGAIVTLVLALASPSAVLARPEAPGSLDVYCGVEDAEGADLADIPQTVFVTWSLVAGADAYEVSSPTEGWSFRCRTVFATVTPDDPRAPVLEDVGLDIKFGADMFARWSVPLGEVRTRSGGRATLFTEGRRVELEVRALPAFDSPASEASDPARTTFVWHDQPSRSAISVTPTPWGVRVSRSSTATGPGGLYVLDGRLEASLDGRTFSRLEQYSATTGEAWSFVDAPVPGMSHLVIGADPAVWPRRGFVLPGVLTLGRFRVGKTTFDPRSRTVWYRQRHTVEIQEMPDGSREFYRFGASSAAKRHVPKPAPVLGRIRLTRSQTAGTKALASTIKSAAARGGRIDWRLYHLPGGQGGPSTPAAEWRRAASGVAAFGKSAGTLTPYRLSVRLLRKGSYRLDVMYGGSATARPDGYSVYFYVR